MNKKNKGFTLIELTISVFILSIIILGVSASLVKISQNFSQSTLKIDIFEQIKEFNFDTSSFQYSSGIVYTGGLLLYNEKKGLLIGSFLDKNKGYDYTFSYDLQKYNKQYFGMFYLNNEVLTSVLSKEKNIEDLVFNNGKIYSKIVLKDILVIPYNAGKIFEMQLDIFYKYQESFSIKNKTDIFIPINDYFKINLTF